MESFPSQRDSRIQLAVFDVDIWCTVRGEDEEEVKESVYKYCQRLKELFNKELVVKAIEVGIANFDPV